MRSLQYMLDNWANIPPENTYQAQHERFYRAKRQCKKDHVPIREVATGNCALCAIETRKRHREKKVAAQRLELAAKNELEKMRRMKELEEERINQEERRRAEAIQNRCETLDQIKTGVLFLVKGRCAI